MLFWYFDLNCMHNYWNDDSWTDKLHAISRFWNDILLDLYLLMFVCQSDFWSFMDIIVFKTIFLWTHIFLFVIYMVQHHLSYPKYSLFSFKYLKRILVIFLYSRLHFYYLVNCTIECLFCVSWMYRSHTA